MRSPLLCFLFLLGSCSGTTPEVSRDSTSSAHRDTLTILERDSILRDSLIAERNSFVKERFQLKKQDWQSWQYYHGYWNGFGGQHHNDLACLVSGYSGITLVSSLDSKHCGQEHNRIEVVIGDSTFESEVSIWHEAAVQSGPGSTECTTFSGESADKIVAAIARHYKKTITVKVYRDQQLITAYELPEFSRKAFKDCVPLNNYQLLIEKYDHSDDWADSL